MCGGTMVVLGAGTSVGSDGAGKASGSYHVRWDLKID